VADRLLGRDLGDRVAAVETDAVPELLKRLRSRGYAPVDEALTGEPLPLPHDPEAAPPKMTLVRTPSPEV
jgi:hypothetical protein